ncbi:MAG: MATE family efflux transporter [Oscillospiraceae bacterium]|nr:MATE family efflux transporter [Oscillospiraceae bacterium]
MDMTKGKEWRNILFFTLPLMAGNLLQQLYNTIDGILVGNFISGAALAAVGTSQPMTFLFIALAMGLSVGVSVVVSQYFGAGKHDSLPAAVDTAILLLGTCGLVLTGVSYAIAPFILRTLLNVPEGELMYLAVAYFRVFCFGLFFQFVYNGIAAVLRAIGDSKATLYFLLISTVLSGILTPLFIIVLPWGIRGAAFSTVIAQAVCATVSYIYMRKRFPFIKGGVHWDKQISRTMIRLGAPVAIQTGIVSFGNGAMWRLVNGFGDTVMEAFAAANRLDALAFVPVMGFQQGLSNFTGQNIGAGRIDRVKRGYRATLLMSVSVTVVICALLLIFTRPALGFFGVYGQALEIGMRQVRFFASFFWVFAAIMSVGGLLQGSGDTIIQALATLSALAIRVVTGYLAVHFGILEYSAAWVTLPIGWFFAALISYSRYFKGGWKNKAVAVRQGGPTQDGDE